jgi:hypothetical protein
MLKRFKTMMVQDRQSAAQLAQRIENKKKKKKEAHKVAAP